MAPDAKNPCDTPVRADCHLGEGHFAPLIMAFRPVVGERDLVNFQTEHLGNFC